MKKIKLSEMKQNKEKITCSATALEFAKKNLDMSQENFVLIGTDTQNQITFVKTLFKGGVNQCLVDDRILFKELLINSCTGFIMAHNHPSGDLTPSFEDKQICEKIKKGSEILGLKLLDNLIFSDENFISFFDEDLL